MGEMRSFFFFSYSLRAVIWSLSFFVTVVVKSVFLVCLFSSSFSSADHYYCYPLVFVRRVIIPLGYKGMF